LPRSSNGFGPVIDLEAGTSPRLRTLIVLLHVGVAAGLLSALPAPVAVPACALLLALLCYEWRAIRPPRRIRRAATGDWWLDGSGPFSLQPSTMVTPWLVVLVLHGPFGVRRLPLLPDSLPSHQWRWLRARLRVDGGTRPGD